uniref:2,4-dienoyl-CoA reductase n=1 Tax=Kwoniella dejecticola CBS 10117 TaxID=1296121 RepID=A0A1A5ZZ24_9TREE|nr:uncharacterized protein I303_06618 [Kwoniella dejecticola CBS 10117]OBR83059.1 hypothetical protein I303_06618 [Kwoniella dejecticola CBS 10117]
MAHDRDSEAGSKVQTFGLSKASSIDTATRAQILDNIKAKGDALGIGLKTESGGRMEGRVGVITGVGPLDGIGTATAELFAQEGAKHMYLLDMQEQPLVNMKEWMENRYPHTKITTIVGDSSSSKTISQLIERIVNEEGRLDFYFANAGIHHKQTIPKPLSTTDPAEEFMEVIRMNTLGAFLAIKYASQAMSIVAPEKGKMIPGGSIVLTSSIAGLKAKAGTIAYSAAKAAINSLTQTSAYEMIGKNVRINSIAPCFIETDMTKALFTLSKAGGSYDSMGLSILYKDRDLLLISRCDGKLTYCDYTK